MKRIKKMLAAVFALVILMTITGCGGGESAAKKENTDIPIGVYSPVKVYQNEKLVAEGVEQCRSASGVYDVDVRVLGGGWWYSTRSQYQFKWENGVIYKYASGTDQPCTGTVTYTMENGQLVLHYTTDNVEVYLERTR